VRARAVPIAAIVLALVTGVLLWRGLTDTRGDAPGADDPSRLSPFQLAKVEWLLENRLPCLGCHVINGQGGRLGPDLTGVGTRMSVDAIEQHLLNPQARNPSSIMPPVPMPATWRTALAKYLAEGDRAESAPSPEGDMAIESGVSAGEGDLATGASLYGRLCSGCHGRSGDADGANAAYLPVVPARHADPALMASRTDDWLFDIIARGGYPMNRHPFMPPYGDLLKPQQIRDVVAHLRHLCGCLAPPWSRDGQRHAGRP
jgi:mono/diheme cytochrome c family protein